MESLKLNLDTEINGQTRTFIVEVPYQDGIVATSEFCPTQLLSDTVELIGAIRGETLDKFLDDCHRQLQGMAKLTEAKSEIDRHIGALMAVVMAHLSRNKRIVFGDLLIYVDCFSLLLKAAGFDSDTIRAMYPHITKTIIEMYPDYVDSTPDGSPFTGSRTEEILRNLTTHPE